MCEVKGHLRYPEGICFEGLLTYSTERPHSCRHKITQSEAEAIRWNSRHQELFWNGFLNVYEQQFRAMWGNCKNIFFCCLLGDLGWNRAMGWGWGWGCITTIESHSCSKTTDLKKPTPCSSQVREHRWLLTSHFHSVPNSSELDLVKIAGNFIWMISSSVGEEGDRKE